MDPPPPLPPPPSPDIPEAPSRRREVQPATVQPGLIRAPQFTTARPSRGGVGVGGGGDEAFVLSDWASLCGAAI